MPDGDSERNDIGGLWRVAVLLSGWAFVFFTAPPFGTISSGVTLVDAVTAVDVAIIALSAWVLWRDVGAAVDAGLIELDRRVAVAIVFVTYLVSIPFYTGYRLYASLK